MESPFLEIPIADKKKDRLLHDTEDELMLKNPLVDPDSITTEKAFINTENYTSFFEKVAIEHDTPKVDTAGGGVRLSPAKKIPKPLIIIKPLTFTWRGKSFS